ncbi:siderophore-interacting protein [Amycolatopsis endophytica]|uniref:NADPH-dependent ferric siderophore reductase n=1 Tax=Amycolatopsis endophytica TaxID=860233 RepID=A0A853BD00_9PSEU|nr:siderophore-interacting protein [Amycolatopsis endophytica]NYI92527.1 NADPH-dependent ferric siderophore reductase [Amycolatopsis endophytica]
MARRERRWFPIVLRELEVLRAYDLTPRMRRVVLGGAELGAFRRYGFDLTPFHTEAPDDHVKLFFPEPATGVLTLPEQDDGHLDWPDEPRPIGRDYTPRRFDAEAGELELDFVVHAGGIASGWAASARPGDRIFVAGPKMATVVPVTPAWYLLTGDETALPAIGRWIEELAPGTPVKVVAEVPGPDDELKLGPDAEVTWLHRGDAAPGSVDLLAPALRALDWPSDDVYAWAAGETGVMRGVRDHLRKERGLPAERVNVTGYWKRGESAFPSEPGE